MKHIFVILVLIIIVLGGLYFLDSEGILPISEIREPITDFINQIKGWWQS